MWQFGWANEGELPDTRVLGTNSLDVVWEKIGPDDFIFSWGDYFLKVGRIEKSWWWWCVYYKYRFVLSDKPIASSSEREAKSFAELCFVKHYAKKIILSNRK